MSAFYIATSWDDGHLLDLRIADLLTRFNLTGTFYIARDYLDERLTEAQIRALSAQHEIGAHTLTHPFLTQVDPARCVQEIAGSRDWLQEVTSRPVTAFCYPRGDYNAQVRQLVADTGYTVARTVQQYALDNGSDPLILPTTIQVYPFPQRPIRNLRARFERLQEVTTQLPRLKLPLTALRSWPLLASALLERAAQTGGIWHLWGHSWEIEQYGMWDALEQVLSVASTYTEARCLTNSQLAAETALPA